jgi:hypothetical protein
MCLCVRCSWCREVSGLQSDNGDKKTQKERKKGKGIIVKANFSGKNFRSNISIRKKKQDRQCAYNVTLRRVRVTIVAVEKQ